MEKPLRMWWWSKNHGRFWFLPNKNGKENFGDVLGPYLVEKLIQNEVKYTPLDHPFKPETLITIGSVVKQSRPHCIVWGAGIISQQDKVRGGDFRAVRGPYSRKHLMDLGYEVPEVYGDPGILSPLIYFPKVEKKYDIGIIPHYIHYENIKNNALDGVKIINLFDPIETVIQDILSCKCTISSSLHGVIMSHAYDIPSLWIEFADKLYGDGIKFRDYFSSMNIEEYKPIFIEEITNKFNKEKYIDLVTSSANSLVSSTHRQFCQKSLVEAFPFEVKAKLF